MRDENDESIPCSSNSKRVSQAWQRRQRRTRENAMRDWVSVFISSRETGHTQTIFSAGERVKVGGKVPEKTDIHDNVYDSSSCLLDRKKD